MSDHQEQEDTDSYIMDGEEGAALEAAFSDAASMAASDTPPPSVTPKAAEEEIKALSRKESRAIRWWRIAVLMSLLVTAAAISTATYLVLQEENYEAFESNYLLYVASITDASEHQMENIYGGTRGVARTLAATAASRGQRFPYVTLEAFEVQAGHARLSSGAELMAYTPVIENTQDAVASWVEYSSVHLENWLSLSRRVLGDNASATDYTLADTIWVEENGQQLPSDNNPLTPVWQVSPPPLDPSLVIGMDLADDDLLAALLTAERAIFTPVTTSKLWQGLVESEAAHLAAHATWVENPTDPALSLYEARPHSIIMEPVMAENQLVGVVHAVIAWDRFLAGLVPENGADGIVVVLVNTCGQCYTYQVVGTSISYLGPDDGHDTAYDELQATIPLTNTTSTGGHCDYKLQVYASTTFQNATVTSDLPMIYAISIAVIFVIVAVTFAMYDRFVQRRNDKIIGAAAKSTAILSSLFPSNIRARLFADAAAHVPIKASTMSGNGHASLSRFLDDEELAQMDATDNGEILKSKPIADLFPFCTVLFADIAGFTAWSSEREPTQVFILLETLYRAFDQLARQRGVFKVETIGDCYVAVTGLPEPRKDHAVVMARFARDCMYKTQALTKKLEVQLGPETSDLTMRIGMHSGPVTAGVLRGEKSRFQLFGDTMNTASRMESTGERDQIQLSQETADLLAAAGKKNWFLKRDDKIVAKGKGELQTYWLDLSRATNMNASEHTGSYDESITNDDDDSLSSSSGDEAFVPAVSAKLTRLIDWNTSVLTRMLKLIVAERASKALTALHPAPSASFHGEGETVLDEVKEIITLPDFHSKGAKMQQNPDFIELPSAVEAQLYEYVSECATRYNDHDFHNFEHASHVTMSVVKLLSRIVAPSDAQLASAASLHDHTYGITSDPLTQFACIFSALIHDLDHPGVPNGQMVKEGTDMARKYHNKSVAEQNSVDIAWDMLMQDDFNDLRATIFADDTEMHRFRELVVNSVMATDIIDKDLKALRNARWDKAFDEAHVDVNARDAVNRKATIVIEHLIQASDVSHTMQHWHIYRKWNEKFFGECYQAYKDGRADEDPAENWYEGELGFYDFYIIPLAKKLKECGVFGVSSAEYLNYAMKNRLEWEERGREIVAEMLDNVTKKSKSENYYS